jgi:hypothetical protein
MKGAEECQTAYPVKPKPGFSIVEENAKYLRVTWLKV